MSAQEASVVGQLIDGDVPVYVAGGFRRSAATEHVAVTNPANGEVIARAPLTTPAEIDEAVAAALAAQRGWRNVPVPERARLMMGYAARVKQEQEALARILCGETGKTFADAMGDVWRGIEVIEQACNAPALMMGETVENVARNIDTVSFLQPLGVCAGITPFNFPAMIPLWMFPLAVVCGNAFVLKPSEQDPLTPTRLVELFYECGFPPDLLQLVHGGREQVDALLDHRDIKAVSFVGSVPVGEHVYRRASHNLKRVQCMAGAKNHMVIMPDANREQALSALVGASVGAAGQRCMAISVAVFVGDANEWIDDLAGRMAEVRPGASDDEAAGYGPQISAAARERIEVCIGRGEAEGAVLLLDGRGCVVEGLPDGNWVGPTLFRKVTPEMSVYRDEIFGPVLVCVEVPTLEAALELINACPYGNGTSIFTSSGGAARRFQQAVEVGQVGINIPIPVPLPFFSFTGWKNSFFGDQHAYGKQAVRFYTETKTITSRWFDTTDSVGTNLTINLK